MEKKLDELKQLTGIYHEHQEGALCAQHALNNLLQNPVFSADELAAIAR
jgi:ataxin-3